MSGTHLKNPRDYSGKPAKDMAAEEALVRDAQPIVARCLFCRWRHRGTVAEARQAALEHRLEHHPVEAARKTIRRRKQYIVPGLRVGDEVIAEQNRTRAEREDAERLAKVLRGQARDRLEAA